MYNACEMLWKIFQKLKTELSYDPAIPLPSVCVRMYMYVCIYIYTCIYIHNKTGLHKTLYMNNHKNIINNSVRYKQSKYPSTSGTISYSAAICWNTIWSYKGIQYQYILQHEYTLKTYFVKEANHTRLLHCNSTA